MRNFSYVSTDSAGRCLSVAAHLPEDMALPADDGVSSFTQLKNQHLPPCAMHRRYRLTIRRKFSHLRHHLPTERGGDNSLQPALAGYYSAWQCALRDDDVYLTECLRFISIASVLRRWRRFLPGHLCAGREIQRPCLLGTGAKYRATITECIPMMIRTLMVQRLQRTIGNTACGK